MRVVIVYDNYKQVDGLENAWGFSAVIETGSQSILFDTGGDGEVLLRNMELLGIEPRKVDAVVLSHNHWDHVGGLKAFLAVSGPIPVFIPPEFDDAFRSSVSGRCELIDVGAGHEISRGIFATGTVGSGIPEQAILIHTGDAALMCTGCAHPGVENMVAEGIRVRNEPVSAVLGGFHLKDAHGARIESTIDRLTQTGIRQAGPCHCTGDRARRMFAEKFGDDFITVGAGTQISFQ